MKRTSCCLALTKMTRAVHQMGIDKQKHASQNERTPAICTLLGDYGVSYGPVKTKKGLEALTASGAKFGTYLHCRGFVETTGRGLVT